MAPGRKSGAARQCIGMAAAVALSTASMVFADPAASASFQVNPVQIILPSDRRSASLEITNSDAAPVAIRVTAFAWTQIDGGDVHVETSNVIASPPIFTVPPGKSQLVRIGLKDRAGPGAYRVVLEEIPREERVAGQIKVLLRMDLPLYLVPKGGGTPELRWSAWRDGDGELFIKGQNFGPVHGEVVELSAEQDGSRTVLSQQMGVVLPGSARIWQIARHPDFQVGAPFVLKVRSPASETQTRIVLEQR